MTRWPVVRLVVTHRRRLVKPFQPHGFHDACDLLVIDRVKARIGFKACSDAFSTIKSVLIIKSGLDFCTNSGIGMHF
ncbi:hypothetical protein BHF78_09585 [Corynebacterium diphtheriae]|nr:hypothetical protein BHF78_09585 [Corynebacterium diphtheriae]OIR85214.1 hypothetical protein BHF85_07760 [Corynebacterium diphtheriae]OIR95203.1 hypothetical protein BHF90_11635 [Corynebacterium diphtheriae]OIS07342.1 hypothetical protein BHF98_09080 [Corynebacterium diphtheriae]